MADFASSRPDQPVEPLLRAYAVLGPALALGLGGGALMGRFMSSYLFDVRPVDLATVSVAITILAVLTSLAAIWPAHRAARLDPARILRA